MANLKPFLDSTKVSLEKTAADAFGAAVETFGRGLISKPTGAVSGSTTPPTFPTGNRADGSFYASSYAASLAGGTSYRPKLKFLFKVEFVFTEEAKQAFPNIFGKSSNNDFTFMVKSVDRPKIDFEYEDDINMYNFRTKVLKRIRHRELTVTFLDDAGNRVLDFFRGLMMMQSPITRRQMDREGTTDEPKPTSTATGNGMVFSTNTGSSKNLDNAHRSVINNASGNVIQTIRVKQIYTDPGEQISGSTKEVIYDFLNARIVSFDLDDLNHETSEASTMTMQFDYDWMEIVYTGSLSKTDTPNYVVNAPGINGAPTDITVYGNNNPAVAATAAANGRASGGAPGGNFLGGLLSAVGGIATNQASRALQTITSQAISRAVTTTAGKGLFASMIGSQVSNTVGGLVGAASRDLITGVTSNINLSTAKSFATNVIDSAKGGASRVIGITHSNNDPLGSFIADNAKKE